MIVRSPFSKGGKIFHLDLAMPVFADPLGWKEVFQACILRYSNLYATLSVTRARVLPPEGAKISYVTLQGRGEP